MVMVERERGGQPERKDGARPWRWVDLAGDWFQGAGALQERLPVHPIIRRWPKEIGGGNAQEKFLWKGEIKKNDCWKFFIMLPSHSLSFWSLPRMVYQSRLATCPSHAAGKWQSRDLNTGHLIQCSLHTNGYEKPFFKAEENLCEEGSLQWGITKHSRQNQRCSSWSGGSLLDNLSFQPHTQWERGLGSPLQV